MEKTMTAESLYHELFLYHPEYDEKEWVGNYDDFLAHEKQRKLSLINQFKESICRDVAHRAWIQATRKNHEPLTEDGFSSFIENYLKSNP